MKYKAINAETLLVDSEGETKRLIISTSQREIVITDEGNYVKFANTDLSRTMCIVPDNRTNIRIKTHEE